MSSPSRRRYDRVARTEEEEEEGANNEEEIDLEAQDGRRNKTKNSSRTESETTLRGNGKDDEDDDDDGERINVVVLDSAQKRFNVSANPDWTIAQLKEAGTQVHKIAAAQQRLIYMGRMLADTTVLRDAGISKKDTIVHLFPKPRVILNSSNAEENDDSCEDGGAHVPRIVLDPEEAEMRSSILVLGSDEVVDAQNNVKLLSFLLLIICSMQLLALFTIMLGVPEGSQDGSSSSSSSSSHPHDDTFDGSGEAIRPWQASDYFDLALNMFGFYSAMLGIKATTENTRALAKRYLICTYICGAFWIGFSYYLSYRDAKEIDEHLSSKSDDTMPHVPETQGDLVVRALLGIMLPVMVWCLCFYRARRFHQLLLDAELEAEARIQTELNLVESNRAGNDDDDDEETGAAATANEEQQALQANTARTIT